MKLFADTSIAELVKEVTDQDSFIETLRTQQEFIHGIETDRAHPYVEDCIARQEPLVKVGFTCCTTMGFAVRVRSAVQKYGPTCHQRDRADVTEFVTLVRLSSLEQHVGVLALAGYKRRKSALTAGPIGVSCTIFVPQMAV